MRRYRAVVIDFRKILRRTGAGFTALAIAAVTFYATSEWITNLAQHPDRVLKSNVTVIDIGDEGMWQKKLEKLYQKGMMLVLGFVPSDGKSVLRASMPVMAAVPEDVPSEEEQKPEEIEEIPQENSLPPEPLPYIAEENKAPIKTVDARQKTSATISNETSYGVDIGEMLSSKPDISIRGDRPEILITHTHATECYAPQGSEFYDVTASDRSEDKEKNVVAVGRKMKEVFENCGIETIHDEILHDAPSFNGSYAHSLNTVEEYMEKYPSIQVVLDIHRDSIVYADKTKAKLVTEIDGRKAAQLMFVVGTDANGLYHPNWRKNMKAALHFQGCISEKYPGLMRHINLRKERFNGHTSSASMIIEVGASGNSLDEALFSAELAAECIADYLMSL